MALSTHVSHSEKLVPFKVEYKIQMFVTAILRYMLSEIENLITLCGLTYCRLNVHISSNLSYW